VIRIHVVECGNGDTILIEFPNGKFGLVDCNLYSSACRETGSCRTYNYLLSAIKNKKLSFVCLTHFHEDHFTGMADILDYYEEDMEMYIDCGRVFLDGILNTKYAIDYCTNGLNNKNNELKRICDKVTQIERAGKKKSFYTDLSFEVMNNSAPILPLDLGKGVSVKILLPSRYSMSAFSRYLRWKSFLCRQRADNPSRFVSNISYNDISLMLLIEYQKTKIFLCGDTSRRGWSYLLKNEENIAANFVKVSHHGANSGNHPAIWDRISPQGRAVAVISADGQKHPSQELLNEIRRKAKVFCTNISKHCDDSRGDIFSESIDSVYMMGDEIVDVSCKEASLLSNKCYGTMVFDIDNEGCVGLNWSEHQRANCC
jgi:beta-lactamase superfamily II metal-dependent hydrolase